MPIEGIDDYPEKMTEFELHWASVNVALGGTPATDFELLGNYKVADFSTLNTTVVGALTNQAGLDNDLDFARSDRDDWRAELRQRLILFREACKTLLPNSRYLRALPDTPAEQSDQQKLLDAWDDMAHIWEQINTDQPAEIAPALILRGNYTRAVFLTGLGTMRTRYDAVKAAERAATDGRGVRDELLEEAYKRMVQYRELLPLVLEPGDPLLASMPQITPQPGSTPDPVTASGGWDAIALDAEINFSESTNPNLAHYEVRMSRSSTYDAATATVIATLLPGASSHRTTVGLENSGDTASYKVFVVLSTGNASGSNTVTITRP